MTRRDNNGARGSADPPPSGREVDDDEEATRQREERMQARRQRCDQLLAVADGAEENRENKGQTQQQQEGTASSTSASGQSLGRHPGPPSDHDEATSTKSVSTTPLEATQSGVNTDPEDKTGSRLRSLYSNTLRKLNKDVEDSRSKITAVHSQVQFSWDEVHRVVGDGQWEVDLVQMKATIRKLGYMNQDLWRQIDTIAAGRGHAAANPSATTRALIMKFNNNPSYSSLKDAVSAVQDDVDDVKVTAAELETNYGRLFEDHSAEDGAPMFVIQQVGLFHQNLQQQLLLLEQSMETNKKKLLRLQGNKGPVAEDALHAPQGSFSAAHDVDGGQTSSKISLAGAKVTKNAAHRLSASKGSALTTAPSSRNSKSSILGEDGSTANFDDEDFEIEDSSSDTATENRAGGSKLAMLNRGHMQLQSHADDEDVPNSSCGESILSTISCGCCRRKRYNASRSFGSTCLAGVQSPWFILLYPFLLYGIYLYCSGFGDLNQSRKGAKRQVRAPRSPLSRVARTLPGRLSAQVCYDSDLDVFRRYVEGGGVLAPLNREGESRKEELPGAAEPTAGAVTAMQEEGAVVDEARGLQALDNKVANLTLWLDEFAGTYEAKWTAALDEYKTAWKEVLDKYMSGSLEPALDEARNKTKKLFDESKKKMYDEIKNDLIELAKRIEEGEKIAKEKAKNATQQLIQLGNELFHS
ncbi:unnamed protein product [Amoebophrya sp. A120]|nr:unnamed protein product [Amoebophrya sp. A120]|eukprot:GSA120T00026063001.1